MKNQAQAVLKRFSVVLFVLMGFLTFAALAPSPAKAAGGCGTGATAPCAEATVIAPCNACHSIQIQGGNRNGTDRFITLSTGSMRHILDPKIADWSSIVSSMIGKGAKADQALASGYLNMNYCSSCTGVIMSGPVVVNITDTAATITWTTSLNDWGDGPADSVVFYGTSATALNKQASDSTMTGSHSVTLTGLTASTKYFFQYQSTGADGKTVKYNFDTPFFRTKPPAGGGGGTTTTTFAYVTNRYAKSLSVIDTDKKILQTTFFFDKYAGDVVAAPDGKTVYATTWGNITTPQGLRPSNDLIVIDTATNTIKNTVADIGVDPVNPSNTGFPIQLAITPDGQYLFGMEWPRTLLTISTADLSIIKRTVIDGSLGPVGRLGITPDGATLYDVSGAGYQTVYKIDVASAKNPNLTTLMTPITLPSSPIYANAVAVAAGPDGRAWIPGSIGNGAYSFTMVNPDGTSQVVSRCSGYDVVVTAAGDAVFSSVQGCGGDGIQQFDTALMKSTVFNPDSLNNYAFTGVAVTSDGGTFLAAGDCKVAGCPSQLYLIDASALTVNASVQIGTDPGPTGTINGAVAHKIALAKVTTGAPAGPPPTLIYSANGTTNNSSVIDTTTDTITATIAVGAIPQAVAPTPDGKLIYIVNSDGTISVITRSTQTVTATIPLPDATTGPMSAIVSPGNNLLYVGNHDAQKIYVIDTKTSAITATIPVGSGRVGPNDLAITPDGGTLYAVVDWPAGSGVGGFIAVISTVTNNVTEQITVPPLSGARLAAGTRIAMNPLGGYAYVVNDPYLIILDTVGNGVVTVANLSSGSACNWMSVGVSADGTTLGVSCWTKLFLIDTASLQPTANTGSTITNIITSVSFTGDGAKVYATNSSGYTITSTDGNSNFGTGQPVSFKTTSLDSSTLAVLNTIDMPGMPRMGATSPAVRSVTGGTPISLTAPDLTMTAVSATSPVNLSSTASTNISITDTVANIGATKAGSFVVKYYLSPTNTFNSATAVSIGSRTVSSLNPAATNTATTSLKVSATQIAVGDYYLIAHADGNQQIAEGNEDNNKMPTAGTVHLVAADLVETAVSSPAIGTIVAPGQIISVTDTVVNQGGGASGAFTVSYLLVPVNGTTGAKSNTIGTRSITSLAAGASSTATVNLTIPSTAFGGTFYLQAKPDLSNVVKESNETNNNYTNMTGTITLSTDLIITAVSTTATSITRPATISVTFTVKNQGTVKTGPIGVGFYLSADNLITTTDKQIGTAYNVSAGLAGGATLTATVSLSVPTTVAAGTYYVGAYADSTNLVQETDETNNGLATGGTIVVH